MEDKIRLPGNLASHEEWRHYLSQEYTDLLERFVDMESAKDAYISFLHEALNDARRELQSEKSVVEWQKLAIGERDVRIQSLIDESIQLLHKYGKHLEECQNNKPVGMITGCTCGFGDAHALLSK